MAQKNYQVCGDAKSTRAEAIDNLYKRINDIFDASAAFTVSSIEEHLEQEDKSSKSSFIAYGHLTYESLNPYDLKGVPSKTREEALSSLEQIIKKTAEKANTKLKPVGITIEEDPHTRTFSAYTRCLAEDGSDYWPFVKETAREVKCWPEWKRNQTGLIRNIRNPRC